MLFDVIIAVILFAVLYVNVFHILLWVDERKALHKRGGAKTLPRLSVIIPAHNEEKTIVNAVKHVLQSNYPKNKLEVIVVDDGSTDATYHVLSEWRRKEKQSARVRIFRKPRGGKASALNYGIRFAKGEIIAVMDADSLLSKNALRNCVSYFDDERVAAVTSHILPKGNSILERLQKLEFMVISFTRKLQEGLNLIFATPGPLSLYRSDVLKSLGGFDEKNLTEDIEICWRIIRAGYRVRMAYDARVYSLYPSDLKTWIKQRTRWNMGGVQTVRKYLPSFFDKRRHPIKTWQLPLFLISGVLTLVGLIAFTYLWISFLVKQTLYVIETLKLGGNPFRFFFSVNVDVLAVLGISTFATTLIFVKIVLDEYKKGFSRADVCLFLTVYVLLFPWVFAYALYKMLVGKYGWLTK